MLSIRSWPNAIVHVDGDAFFASVMQTVNPYLKGKPVIVGRDRGIATAVSYEAKKIGIRRGMMIYEIKKKFPACFILDSDYKTYKLFSQKMFAIIKSFTNIVEEYSIDEAFADIKGLRRPLNMSYQDIATSIKDKIEKSLGITVSIGLSLTKSLAKLASSFKKPAGLTIVDGQTIEKILKSTPLNNVWGIGINTTAYLNGWGIKTAFDFVMQSEGFIKAHLTKPFWEIWKELHGKKVYELNINPKATYQSITRSQTFNPATNNLDILWSRLSCHIESAFEEARKFNYKIGKLSLFLKTQQFRYFIKEIKCLEKTAYPFLIRSDLKKAFCEIYSKDILYRTTGCTIYDLECEDNKQLGLFRDKTMEQKVAKIYPLFEKKKVDFGTTLFDRTKQKNSLQRTPLNIPFINLSNF